MLLFTGVYGDRSKETCDVMLGFGELTKQLIKSLTKQSTDQSLPQPHSKRPFVVVLCHIQICTFSYIMLCKGLERKAESWKQCFLMGPDQSCEHRHRNLCRCNRDTSSLQRDVTKLRCTSRRQREDKWARSSRLCTLCHQEV